MTNEKNLPERKFIAGGISATLWHNEGQKRTGEAYEFRTVSLDRRYKDRDGTWKSATSFRVNDLPKAAMVLKKAYEYIVLKEPFNVLEEVVV